MDRVICTMAPNGKGVLVITTEENVGLNEIINAVNNFQKSPEYRPWVPSGTDESYNSSWWIRTLNS